MSTLSPPTPSPPASPTPGAGSPVSQVVEKLLPALLAGQRRALGRGVSLVENGGEGQRLLVGKTFGKTGRARILGVTGPPGAGKSTLVDRLARQYRSRGDTVGVLAVDPTSPFSGGALLGDRIRMQALATDPGVFIRSMATRGAMGGVAWATRDAVDLLDAAGFDRVLVETVGVGQDEVDVARTVDTVVVVTVPGLGDEIQAIKAGIMEIADVFVVNKSDRDGVERTVKDLRSMLAMTEMTETTEMPEAAGEPVWRPPIVKTTASRNEGIEELSTEIDRHGDWLIRSGELQRRRFAHLRRRVEANLQERILTATDRLLDLDRQIEQGFRDREDPYSLAERLFAGVLARDRGNKESYE